MKRSDAINHIHKFMSQIDYDPSVDSFELIMDFIEYDLKMLPPPYFTSEGADIENHDKILWNKDIILEERDSIFNRVEGYQLKINKWEEEDNETK